MEDVKTTQPKLSKTCLMGEVVNWVDYLKEHFDSKYAAVVSYQNR